MSSEKKSFIEEIQLHENKDYQVALEIEEDNLELVVPLTLEAYLRYGNSLNNSWKEIEGARNALDKYHTFVLTSKNTGMPVSYLEFSIGESIDSDTLFDFSMFGTQGEKLPFSQTRRSYYEKIFDFLKESGFIEKFYIKKFKEVTLSEFDYKQRRTVKFFKKIMESNDANLFKKFISMNRHDLAILIQDCVDLSWEMELIFMDEITHFFMDTFWRGGGIYVDKSKFDPEDYKNYPQEIVNNIEKSFVSEPRLKVIPTGSRRKPATHQEIIEAAEELEKLQKERRGEIGDTEYFKSGDFVDYLGTKNIDKLKQKHSK